MITNERQYRITKREAYAFAKAITALLQQERDATPDDALFREGQIAAMRSQLADLQDEISAFEALKSGSYPRQTLDSIDQLPRALIEARIAAGMTQSDLARRLGIHVQQIQRYEAGNYASASLQRIADIAHAVGMVTRIAVSTTANPRS
ncbi:MAG: helix-turn-helix domain-containing protein [Chloroflexota bacterium]|nr:helix-turn-helix domain-containing protein [Chloroflexota bacterium]